VQALIAAEKLKLKMLLQGKNPDGTKKQPVWGTKEYFAWMTERNKNSAPPPVVSFHIEYVIAKTVSRGTDGATAFLFNALDGVVSKIGSKAAGIGGWVTVRALRGAGISFDDLMGSDIAAGNDDLMIRINGIGMWPQANGTHSISSGDKDPVQMSWNLGTNMAHRIDLVEHDSGSADDSLGYINFPVGSLRPGFSEEIVVSKRSEGSVYVLKISIDLRYPDEKDGYKPASKWLNNKAYCFPVYGCN
jgi:hypothetical protein